MQITIKEIENGFYLTATTKGIKYGQGYKDVTRFEALTKFKKLIKTYQTKGDLYVMRYGA